MYWKLSYSTLQIPGKLAAVDATKETKLGAEFSVKGYPTIKYFKDGEFAFDVSSAREKDKIIEFMSDPKVNYCWEYVARVFSPEMFCSSEIAFIFSFVLEYLLLNYMSLI